MLKDEPAILTQRSAHPLDRSFVATCAVLSVALVCSIVVIAAPRPVQPSRLPALRVPLAQAGGAFGEPIRNVQPLPKVAWFERWYELYSEAGLNERERAVDLDMVNEQRREIARISHEELPKLGDKGVRALMDTLTDRALAARTLREPPTEAYGLLGGFPALLARYGYTDDAQQPVAPPRVIDNLYRQRFNLICDRALEQDLDASDRALAEGWIALHGKDLPPERRAKAAHTFAQLGGIDAREALAVWLYHGELVSDAIALLEAEYAHSGALRVRNMLLFLRRGT